MSSPFIHGRSFFEAARHADITVKPLLLYYGVVALSRGVTLVLSRGLREAALTPSHGLTNKGWGHVLSLPNPDFSAVEITMLGGGTLPELDKATAGKSLLRGSTSVVNLTQSVTLLPAGEKFSLGEIIGRLPALQEHSFLWLNKTECMPVAIETVAGNPTATIKLMKYGRPYRTRHFANLIMAGSPFTFSSEDAESCSYVGPNLQSALPPMTDNTFSTALGIGELWLQARLLNGGGLSKISALFCLSYALGMLVRYFPAQWTALLHGQIDNSALPTLLASIDVIESEFPDLILDFLET